ncbi:MRG MORF4L-binding isoform X2 [Brachionus plicatilis]|uniref:MRG MORF4L-binding isoform X2 n=1 Tax=Brachionus plicatilis TaxID=10195 RepID=A0A3M7RYS0_BRAPC|nr:MRG MORF4L-binding isoform X2 [Brachionus plicatilis]
MSCVVWTPEMEVSLFYAMIDHKPIGENKHFHMAFIYEKFNNLSDKKLSIEQIWQHLDTLYDLKGLDENEIVAFPNEEVEFSLPEIKLKNKSENDNDQNKTSEKSNKAESRKSTSGNKSQPRSASKKK